MDLKLLESLRGKSREERLDFLNGHRDELGLSDLSLADGGVLHPGGGTGENPKSSGLYKGNYWTSWGFICEGQEIC